MQFRCHARQIPEAETYELPTFAKVLLVAAYVASRTRDTMDRTTFDPSARRKRRRKSLAHDKQVTASMPTVSELSTADSHEMRQMHETSFRCQFTLLCHQGTDSIVIACQWLLAMYSSACTLICNESRLKILPHVGKAVRCNCIRRVASCITSAIRPTRATVSRSIVTACRGTGRQSKHTWRS